MERRGSAGGVRYLVVAACLVVLMAGLKAASAIFVPFFLALFLASISFPLLFWLRRHRVPAVIAVALTVLAVVAVVGVFGLFLIGSVDGVAAAAPRYQARCAALLAPVVERIELQGLEVSDWINQELLDFGRLASLATNTAYGLASAVSTSFVVLLVMSFIFTESVGFRAKLVEALGKDNDVFVRFGNISREVQQYLLIKTAVSLATGILVGMWVWILGVDFPVLWGVLAFLLNYIPSIGSVLAGIPPAILALIQDEKGPTYALLIIAGYAVVNLLLGNILEPNLLGRRLRLSPLIVLLSLLVWGWVWGPAGMLLAVPLTMVLKILFENTERLRWLAVLMDQNPRSLLSRELTPVESAAGADKTAAEPVERA